MRYPILQHIVTIARYPAPNSFAILSLQASRDMRSIAAGPLSRQVRAPPEKAGKGEKRARKARKADFWEGRPGAP